MSESDGQKLCEHLTQLHNGVESQKTRQDSLEASVTLVQSMVSGCEEKLDTATANAAAAQETRHQQLDLTIQNLEEQIQDLRHHIKAQISGLTTELRSVFASVHISSPPPSPSLTLPPVNNIMTSCPSFNTSASYDSSVHPHYQ